MLAGSEVVRPGVRVVRGRQGGGAPQPGEQVGWAGGVEAGQGEPHRQGMAVQPVQQLPERPAFPLSLGGGVGGEQMAGVLCGLGPVQPAHADPADLAEPALLRPAGDDHRGPGVVPDPLQEALQRGTVRLVQRRGRAGRVGHLPDSLEVVPHQQHPQLGEQPFHLGQPLCGDEPGEVGAEHGQAEAGDHPVQPEAGEAGLERMPEHQPRVIHPAGVPPPPGEPLGQLALPRPPGTGQDHHALQPHGGLQLVDQVIPADKQAVYRGQRIGPCFWLWLHGPDLVQRGIQRRRGGRPGGAGLREPDLLAQVVDRDEPVGQRHVPSRARPPVMPGQPPPPSGDRLPDAGSGEQGLVERGHELRRGDRVHAVGHRHHRRAPRLQQRGGDGGFEFLADRAGLARVQDRHRHFALGQHRRDLRRRYKVTAAAWLLERQHPLTRAGHHRRPGPHQPATRSPAGHHPVPIEMHHMKRLTARRRRGQRFAQGIECGRAQHGQVNLAADRVQPFHQRAGHHLIPHIGGPGRAGDHHQHPQLPARHLQRPRAAGDRQAAGDPARPERDGAGAVAHQLPRQAQQARIGGTEHHLQALIAGPLVSIARRTWPEDRPEDQVPPPGQPILDPRAAVFPHPERRQQVILQIPAQILQRIRIQRPR